MSEHQWQRCMRLTKELLYSLFQSLELLLMNNFCHVYMTAAVLWWYFVMGMLQVPVTVSYSLAKAEDKHVDKLTQIVNSPF